MLRLPGSHANKNTVSILVIERSLAQNSILRTHKKRIKKQNRRLAFGVFLSNLRVIDPQGLCVIVHYCWQFVVVQVNRNTVGLSFVAVTSSLSNMVVAVMSGCLHPTAAHAAKWWEEFRAVTLEFTEKIHFNVCTNPGETTFSKSSTSTGMFSDIAGRHK